MQFVSMQGFEVFPDKSIADAAFDDIRPAADLSISAADSCIGNNSGPGGCNSNICVGNNSCYSNWCENNSCIGNNCDSNFCNEDSCFGFHCGTDSGPPKPNEFI